LDDFEEIFRKFRDESTRFSKDLYQKFYASSRATRGAAANVNLVLAKTVFSKWSIEILTILYGVRAAGFREIEKKLGLISSRVLSQKLKKLEAIGLIQRSVINVKPTKVMYTPHREGAHRRQAGGAGLPLHRIHRGDAHASEIGRGERHHPRRPVKELLSLATEVLRRPSAQ
jgi:DNA-binding HxlR family transcriptional regulator